MKGRRRRGRPVWPMLLAAGVVVGVVVAMAFFVRGFDTTGSDNIAAPAPSPTPGAGFAAPASPASAARTTKYVEPGSGRTITLGANDAPGIRISTRGQHRLLVRVSSAQPVYAVGWLIPTSMDHSYGKDMHAGTHFSLATTVTGRPDYAIIWIWAGKAGAPATCTISVDGHVRTTRTTSGSYGRQICFG